MISHDRALPPKTARFLTLRNAAWLTGDRALAWARVLALATLAALAVLMLLTCFGNAPDPFGRPLATDFSSFWAASTLALAGPAASALDPAVHEAAQHAQFAAVAGYAPDYYAFFYPPPFLLICLLLGLLPYGAAAVAWIVMTSAAYLAIMRRLLPPRWPTVTVALAFPAVLVNAGHGQNGALSAALLGGAALHLDRRPRLAGACLGALCFKPQLALLVVPALAAARRWRALAWAAGMAGALCLASLIALGPQAWAGFLASAPRAEAALQDGAVGYGKMVSAFAGVRLVGLGLPAAWAGQAALLAAGLLAMLAVARRRPGGRTEIAALATAGCLVTPFLLDYDLMLLGVPLAWLASEAAVTGYRPYEKTVLAVAFALPLIARPLALHAGLPIAPGVIAALLGAVVARACIGTGRPPWVTRFGSA